MQKRCQSFSVRDCGQGLGRGSVAVSGIEIWGTTPPQISETQRSNVCILMNFWSAKDNGVKSEGSNPKPCVAATLIGRMHKLHTMRTDVMLIFIYQYSCQIPVRFENKTWK